MRYRAVFFDAGETLLHPHPSFSELFTRLLEEEGHTVDPERFPESLRMVGERFIRASQEGQLWSTSEELSRAWWREVYELLLQGLGLPLDEGLAQKLYRTFTDPSTYRLFSDVVPTLGLLHRARLTLGLISNFEAWLEHLLESLEVARFFDVRVISGVEGMEKPDPRIFQLALQRADLPAEASVYVGDNPTFDTEPAEAVGMHAVLIDRRDRYSDHAGTRITTLRELPAVIGLERAVSA